MLHFFYVLITDLYKSKLWHYAVFLNYFAGFGRGGAESHKYWTHTLTHWKSSYLYQRDSLLTMHLHSFLHLDSHCKCSYHCRRQILLHLLINGNVNNRNFCHDWSFCKTVYFIFESCLLHNLCQTRLMLICFSNMFTYNVQSIRLLIKYNFMHILCKNVEGSIIWEHSHCMWKPACMQLVFFLICWWCTGEPFMNILPKFDLR